MSDKRKSKPDRETGAALQLNLIGLVIFSVSLVFAGGLLGYLLAAGGHHGNTQEAHSALAREGGLGKAPEVIPPWGELLTYDVRLEQPDEYLAFELDHIRPPKWVFESATPDKVRQEMLVCGLSAQQTDRALATASVAGGNIAVMPDSHLIFSLAPDVRAKLYHELARSSANQYMQFPFFYEGNAFEETFAENKTDPATTAMVRKLLYLRGNLHCFSDYEAVLQKISDPTERLRFLRALSSQSAVLARVRIRPETDIDKVLNYWAWPGGIRFKDVRPLLDSLKDLPEGGTVSLLYLLPQFARQRLYTYPMPSKAGDPAMDCHWSTMNFFNETPDDRFANPAYTAQYLAEHYYKIAKPSVYGDIILFLDASGGTAVHSAVYLADDIVFTKNGNNMAQPWMLMRLKDLVAKYESDSPAHYIVYRNKNW